jgi:CheY-like chemotaxis protein
MQLLLVEDDPDLSHMLATWCELEGYRVVRAAHGRQALDLLQDGARPDVILLDLMMPVMDGWGFRAAQRREPALASIPVIVLSAIADRVQMADIAPVAAFQKPIQLDQLLDALHSLKPN